MVKKRWYAAKAIGMSGCEYFFSIWASSRNHAKRLSRQRMREYECVRFRFLGEMVKNNVDIDGKEH